MKIGLVSYTFLPMVGGAEFVVHYLAQQWARQGHEVCVINGISDRPTMPDAPYGVRKYRVCRGSTRFGYHRFGLSHFTVASLRRVLRDFRPDAISAHFGYPTGYWLSRITPVPRYVLTCHGNDITPFYWGDRAVRKSDEALKKGLHSAARVMAISTYCRDFVNTTFGVPEDNITYIPNGVDIQRFQKNVCFDLRKHFHLADDAQVVLSVGREHPQKDFRTGLNAFAMLSNELPKARYVILGRGVGAHKEFVEQLGMGGKVILCDGLMGDDLVGAYQQADVLFSCSIWELHSLVVMEAMAAGTAIVATNISGSPDVIESGENGYIVEPEDAAGMAAALGTLLGDSALRDQMRDANRRKAEGYDWSRISKAYLEYMI